MTPLEYSRSRSAWRSDDWWLLEAVAFRDHPRALTALASQMPKHLWRQVLHITRAPGGGLETAIGGFLLLVSLVTVVLMPLLALRSIMFFFFAGADADAELVAWQPGVVSIAASVSMLGLSIRSHSARLAGSRSYRSLLEPLVSVICAPILLAVAMHARDAGRLEGSDMWLIGIAAAIVAAIVAMIITAKPLPGSRALGAIESLAPQAQEAATADLRAAIDALADHGLITREQRSAALQAPLGTLGSALGTPRKRPKAGDEQLDTSML